MYKNWWDQPGLVQEMTHAIEECREIRYISEETSRKLVSLLDRTRAAIAGYQQIGKVPSGPKMLMAQLSDLVSMAQCMEGVDAHVDITDGVYAIQIRVERND